MDKYLDWSNGIQAKLNDIIVDLASFETLSEDEEKKEDFFTRIAGIYDKYSADDHHTKFRHYYSKIFGKLIELFNQKDSEIKIQVLMVNLKIMQDYISKKDNLDLIIDYNKLYDHISLEISQIEFYRSENLTYSDEIKNLNKEMVSLRENFTKANKQYNRKINDSQKEFISILGIFACIITAFAGGLSFSGAIFSNIEKSSIYRIIALSCIVAIFFFNVICIMYVFVIKIKNSNTENKGPKIDRFVYIAFMVIFCGILIFDFFAYKNKWLEQKDFKNLCDLEVFVVRDIPETPDPLPSP